MLKILAFVMAIGAPSAEPMPPPNSTEPVVIALSTAIVAVAIDWIFYDGTYSRPAFEAAQVKLREWSADVATSLEKKQ